jgi:hypothetical protein
MNSSNADTHWKATPARCTIIAGLAPDLDIIVA